MSALFHRQYSVTIGTAILSNVLDKKNSLQTTTYSSIRFNGLRVEFNVAKSLGKEPNSLDMRITNLAEKTRATMTLKGAPVILTAGYNETEAQIFSGNARTIDHVDNGHEITSHVQCGDGEREYTQAVCSLSFGAGTSVADVIRATAKTFNLGMGNVEEVLAAGNFRGGLTKFNKGFTSHGRSSEVFDKLVKSIGYTWSVQSGQLQLLLKGEPVRPTAVLLNKDTGLIGSPDYAAPEKKGGKSTLKLRSLLQPTVHCGGIIQVDSQFLKGQFVVQKLHHVGDTHGPEWYTLIEATAL